MLATLTPLPRRLAAPTVSLLAGLLGVMLSAPTTAARAEDRVGDWSTPSEHQCVPECRDGYECHRGECAPICSPACDAGFLCTAGGACVRVESSAPAPREVRAAPTDACLPSCRAGYTCLERACVSRCNPICARGETCSDAGECVPETAPGEVAAPPPPRARPTVVDVYADALGALQLGLAPTVEVGSRVTGYLGVRALNTGVSSYFVLGRDREDEFRWGVGALLGLHVFSAREGNPRGFYGGPVLEYAYVATRDVKRDFADYRTHVLVPGADFGHRWDLRGLLLGVSVRAGLAIPLADDASPLGSTGCRRPDACRADHRPRFVPGVSLDLGYFVPRR